MPNELAPAATLDSTDLPLSDYRALREGKEVPVVEKTSEKPAVEPVTESVAALDAAAQTEEQKEAAEKAKKGDKLNQRFSELTGQIRELKQQLAAKSGTGQPEPAVSKPEAAAPVKPLLKDFTDYETYLEKHNEYLEKRQDYLIEQREQQRTKADEAKARETQAKTVADTWAEKTKAAEAKHEDFAEVALKDDLPVTPAMADAIRDSEIGPEILYHLGKNPDEAARISKLSPIAAIRAIGKLEASLAVEATEPQTKTPPVSKAPEPIRPVGGSRVNPVKDIEGMTQSEYRAYREAGKIR
jgi:chemotaxis protein histidine kinase CheA